MDSSLHKLYQLIQKGITAKSANAICSPFNIATCLSMLADGASGKSREELIKCFNYARPGPNTRVSLQGNTFNVFSDILFAKSSIAGMVKTGQALFVSKAILPAYAKKTQESYRALVKQITSPAATVAEVNAFVAECTQNHITDLLKESDVDSSTLAILVAALFFKGKWQEPFPKENTQQLDFHVNDKTVKKVPTMYHKKKDISFISSQDGVMTVAIPYQGDELCFVGEVYQNSSPKTLPPTNLEQVQSVAMRPGHKKIEIYLPKFKATSELDLKAVLESAGCESMFNPTTTDFVGTMSEVPIYVSKVIHKAVVEVDEEGTVAAAATATMMLLGCARMPVPDPIIRFDRPFHFHIVARKTGVILFSGSISDPTVS